MKGKMIMKKNRKNKKKESFFDRLCLFLAEGIVILFALQVLLFMSFTVFDMISCFLGGC